MATYSNKDRKSDLIRACNYYNKEIVIITDQLSVKEQQLDALKQSHKTAVDDLVKEREATKKWVESCRTLADLIKSYRQVLADTVGKIQIS